MLGEAGEAAVLALMVIFAVIALVLGAALLQIRHELPRGLGATLRDAVGWSALATLCGRHAPVGDADAAGRGAGSLALGAKPRGADHVVIGEGGGDAFGRSGAGGALRHRPSRVLKADDITEDKTYEWEIDVTRLSMKRIIGKGNFGCVRRAGRVGRARAGRGMRRGVGSQATRTRTHASALATGATGPPRCPPPGTLRDGVICVARGPAGEAAGGAGSLGGRVAAEGRCRRPVVAWMRCGVRGPGRARAGVVLARRARAGHYERGREGKSWRPACSGRR